MLQYFQTQLQTLQKMDGPANGSWVCLIAPTEQELNQVAGHYRLEMDVLKAALDLDERSRIETEEGQTLILVDIPMVEASSDRDLYNTIPLSIIILSDTIITVCSQDSPIFAPFRQGRVKGFHTAMKSRFVLQLLYHASTLYLQYLRTIDRKSEEVEAKLHKSTQNRELIELLKLEKSLVYFTTSLRANEVVLEKLLRMELIKRYPEDSELLEDVIIENKQAIEMANIYSGILSGTMDAFASVISNNLNIVMKVLAVITTVMAIPTMIFSAYGMNVHLHGMPFAQSPYGFPIIISMAALCSAAVTMVFVKLRMFK